MLKLLIMAQSGAGSLTTHKTRVSGPPGLRHKLCQDGEPASQGYGSGTAREISPSAAGSLGSSIDFPHSLHMALAKINALSLAFINTLCRIIVQMLQYQVQPSRLITKFYWSTARQSTDGL